jgi:hypothetical protein
VGFRLIGADVITGKGVSGVGDDESFGRVDSAVTGVDSIVFGKTGELVGSVAANKLQAEVMNKIASNARILVDFIFPPEKLFLHFISFLLKRKPSSRAGRGCRAVSL